MTREFDSPTWRWLLHYNRTTPTTPTSRAIVLPRFVATTVEFLLGCKQFNLVANGQEGQIMGKDKQEKMGGGDFLTSEGNERANLLRAVERASAQIQGAYAHRIDVILEADLAGFDVEDIALHGSMTVDAVATIIDRYQQ